MALSRLANGIDGAMVIQVISNAGDSSKRWASLRLGQPTRAT